ncbi:MAG: hypothetical protein B0W54_05015 [Cellvibrio sp. 79]|nr:MAG: hypothetical protein B0W54_05015 [Cellvibrio sp. 79]
MATVNPYGVERRQTLDRRSGVSHSVTNNSLTAVDWIAMTLLIVGGINWGLIGLFNVDLVAELFGVMSPVSRIVYVLVGLSALCAIFTATKLAKKRSA